MKKEDTFHVATSPERKLEEHERLRDNAMEGFRLGADLDLRLRIAIDILQHNPGVFEAAKSVAPAYNNAPEDVARYTLDVVCELVDLAAARGMVHPFSSDGYIDRWLKSQVERKIDFAFYEQKVVQRRQQEHSKPSRAEVMSMVGKGPLDKPGAPAGEPVTPPQTPDPAAAAVKNAFAEPPAP